MWELENPYVCEFYFLDQTWPQDPWPHMHPIRETICCSGLPREGKSFFFGSMTTRRLLKAIIEFQTSNSLDGSKSSWSHSVDLRHLMLESKKFWKRSKSQLKRTQKLSLRNPQCTQWEGLDHQTKEGPWPSLNPSWNNAWRNWEGDEEQGTYTLSRKLITKQAEKKNKPPNGKRWTQS